MKKNEIKRTDCNCRKFLTVNITKKHFNRWFPFGSICWEKRWVREIPFVRLEITLRRRQNYGVLWQLSLLCCYFCSVARCWCFWSDFLIFEARKIWLGTRRIGTLVGKKYPSLNYLFYIRYLYDIYFNNLWEHRMINNTMQWHINNRPLITSWK